MVALLGKNACLKKVGPLAFATCPDESDMMNNELWLHYMGTEPRSLHKIECVMGQTTVSQVVANQTRHPSSTP